MTPPAPGSRRRQLALGAVRFVVLLVPLVGLALLARVSGLLELLEVDRLQAVVAELGWVGPVVFCGLLTLGVTLQVPGGIFVTAAVLAYGPLGGLAMMYFGGLVANQLTFEGARLVRRFTRRHPISLEDTPRLVRSLAGAVTWFRQKPVFRTLEARPTLAVCLVRLLVPTASVASFAFAYSEVRRTEYLLGGAVGMVPQVTVVNLLLSASLGLL